MSDLPRVSILTPVYNAERFLEATLKSVQAQTFKDYEHLLVIDAKSNDSSLAIAERFAKEDPRIKIVAEGTKGVVANRNRGLEKARGDLIAFIDADDLWRPEKLRRQIEFMARVNARFSCTSFVPISEEGTPCGRERRAEESVEATQLLYDNTVGCLTVVFERSLLGATRFRESSHEDLLFWYELTKGRTRIFGLPEVLADYRVVRGSRSNDKLKAAQGRWNLYRRQLGLSIPSAILKFCVYGARGVAKRLS